MFDNAEDKELIALANQIDRRATIPGRPVRSREGAIGVLETVINQKGNIMPKKSRSISGSIPRPTPAEVLPELEIPEGFFENREYPREILVGFSGKIPPSESDKVNYYRCWLNQHGEVQ